MQEIWDPIVPESVEAVLLTRESLEWTVNWCKGEVYRDGAGVCGAVIPTLQGRKIAPFGAHIARKRSGDFVIFYGGTLTDKYKRRT